MNHVRYFIVPSLAFVLLISSLVWFTGCRSSRQSVDLTQASNVDLSRYLGLWYEIARFDHWFERGMTHTMATYTMREDGCVLIVNTGLKDGKLKVANGKGKRTHQQGLLRVSFFWPFYSDYRILWVDENYQYALVGGDSSEYLWILARTPSIDALIKNIILSEAKRRGYDIDKLIWVEQ
jgi:lipocalin